MATKNKPEGDKFINLDGGDISINATHYGKMSEAEFMQEMNLPHMAETHFADKEDRQGFLKDLHAKLAKKAPAPEVTTSADVKKQTKSEPQKP